MGRDREKLVLANGPTPKITPQTDEPPIIYLSQTVTHTRELEEELIRCSGVRYRCFSFVYLIPDGIYWAPRTRSAYELNVERKQHVMMDSGAFSFHNFVLKKKSINKLEQLREKTIQQWVQFWKKHSKEWDFGITFDYVEHQPTIRMVTKRLEDEGCAGIVPVYHGDSTLDNLKWWLDNGYKRVCIGSLGWRRKNHKFMQSYYDAVFRVAEPYKVKLHGLAVTSLYYTFNWPWHSVDSSAWARVGAFGGIYGVDPIRGALGVIHVSLTGQIKTSTQTATQLSPNALASVRQQVEARGWDFDLLRRSLAYRYCHNAWLYAHVHEHRKMLENNHARWGSLIV